MSSIKPRLLTAVIGIPLVLIILILSESFPWIMYLAIAIVTALMTYEVLSARRLDNNFMILVPCLLFSFIEPLLASTLFMIIPLYIFALLLFLVMIVYNDKIKFITIAYAMVCTCLITLGMTSILRLSAYMGGYISFSFVVIVGISWVSDAGAYFAGVSLGRTKLCPNISPNKTVEGFIGGIVAGSIISLIIGLVYSLIYSDVNNFNYLALFLVGLFGSLVSVLGDLTFSLVKRYCGIKDYGSIFPGHGGMLDRFDSVIFVAPLVYMVAKIMPLVLA